MPAITTANFSLSDDFLISCGSNKDLAEKEIYKRLISVMNIFTTIDFHGEEGKILTNKINEMRSLLSTQRNTLPKGYLIKEVGGPLFDFAAEIYSKDPEVLVTEFKKRRESVTGGKFNDIIESVLKIYKNIEKETLINIFRIAIEIIDIVGACSI